MEYESLYKIYYKDPSNYDHVYQNRFSAPFTKHLPVSIKQYNRQNSYTSFYCYTEEIVRLLTAIHTANCALEKQIKAMPYVAITQFYKQSLVDEIKSTNDIEGVHSTRREINIALDSQITGDKSKRFWSIVNKYHDLLTTEFIQLKTAEDIRSLYDSFALKEVISENPNNAPDGLLFRSGSVSIDNDSQKEIHRGLYPEKEITKTLNLALEILNSDDLMLLINISIFHYFFGYIHPFYDGNGRTSRLITSYYLSKELQKIISLRISVIIKKNKSKYYEIFNITNSEINKGDLTPFITYFLNIIFNTIIDTSKILDKKSKQLAKYKEILNEKLKTEKVTDKLTKNIYFILLQAALFNGNGATIDDIVKTTKKSRNTIDSRISPIPKEHIIKNTSTRPYRYRLNLMFLRK